MTFLSLIIPCYNVSEYLPATLRSLTQLKDAEDCEFIFVNDGSTDNTLLLLTDFAKKDKRAIIIDQKNQGVSAARNRALEIVQGRYILCLDGDDCLHANTMTIIKENIHDSDALLSPCIFQKNGKNKMQDIHITNGIYSIEQLYKSCSVFPTAPMLVYSSTIIQRNQLQFSTNLKSGEVYDFTINYMQYVDTIYVLNFPIFNYFQRFDSAVHRLNYKNDLTVVDAIESIYKNGKNLLNFSSFSQTAFLLFKGFIYTKYLKSSTLENEMLCAINYSLSNRTIKRCVINIAFKSHSCRNRFLAIYLILLPNCFGFKLLKKLYSLKMNLN